MGARGGRLRGFRSFCGGDWRHGGGALGRLPSVGSATFSDLSEALKRRGHPDAVRAAIGVMPQDTVLFTDTLIRAHRLSTVVHADQILVIEDGQITERGTHPSLLDAKGAYAALWDKQRKEQPDQKSPLPTE